MAVRSVMDVAVTGDGIDVAIDLWAHLDGEQVAHRTWREQRPAALLTARHTSQCAA